MRSLLILLLLCGPVLAQESPPSPMEVDVAEVLRRGDTVTVSGEGPRNPASAAFGQAVATPPDDSYMWHVSVWHIPGCQPCKSLMADFRDAQALLAFVSAPQNGTAWAHYHEFDGSDETQKFRREAFKIKSYPTVIIQVPRNGSWGTPGTVVFWREGYETPEKLASEMSAALKKYAAWASKNGYPRQPSIQEVEAESTSQATSPGFAVQFAQYLPLAQISPPFPEPAKPAPFNPQPYQPQQVIPPVTPGNPLLPTDNPLLQLLTLLAGMLESGVPANLTLLILGGLKAWKKFGPKPTPTPQATPQLQRIDYAALGREMAKHVSVKAPSPASSASSG